MEDLLPDFELPKPTKKRGKKRRRFPLFKAIIDSISTFTIAPLVAYVHKEWRAMKRYPGFLTFCVLVTAIGVWYGTRWFYVEAPYTGETSLKVFFPGNGEAPQVVSTHNIYRYSVYRAEIHHTLATKNEKGEPLENTAVTN